MTAPDFPWLYRTAASGIQTWISETQRLEELAGASLLIDELTVDGLRVSALTETLRRLFDAKGEGGRYRVYARGAGGATLGFQDAMALRRFAEEWPMVVSFHAPRLSVAQGWIQVDQHPQPLRALDEAVRQDGAQRWAELPESGPLLALTGRTGQPAVDQGDRVGKKDLRDAATRRKVRRARRHDDGAAPPGFIEDGSLKGALGFAKDDTHKDRLVPGDSPVHFTVDAEPFGEGYLGVVHIDGTGVGDQILAIRDVSKYEDFCKDLTAATLAAARSATSVVIDRERRRRKVAFDAGRGDRRDAPMPFRPVVLGGDDVTMLMKAEDALAFVSTFIQHFEQETRARVALAAPHGLRAGAGVALVKVDFPTRQAIELAEELCKAAKDVVRRKGATAPSVVLFHRLTTAFCAPWSEIKQQELGVVRRGEPISSALSMGPYLLSSEDPSRTASPASRPTLDQLRRLAIEMRRLPRGPFREWLRVTMQDEGRGQRHWERLQEVARGRDAWEGLAAALVAMGVDDATGFTRPTRESPHPRTPVLDALTWLGIEPNLREVP